MSRYLSMDLPVEMPTGIYFLTPAACLVAFGQGKRHFQGCGYCIRAAARALVEVRASGLGWPCLCGRPRTCEDCGDAATFEGADPFVEEVDRGRQVHTHLCDECFRTAVMDI